MKRISAIQKEIRQTKPFSSRAQEAGLGLLRTADVLTRRTADLLLPYGLTPQQYNVLRILRGAGAAGLPTLEIAERMIQRAPGITRLLDRLEAKRLVTRQRCPEDRRQVLCYIAPDGLSLLGRLDAPIGEDDGMLNVLSSADLHKLIGFLDRIRAAAAVPRIDDPGNEIQNALDRAQTRSQTMTKKLSRILAVLGVSALATLSLQASDTYNIDKGHSEATFRVRHLVSKVQGRFTDFNGTVDIDAAKPEASSVSFTIAAASINTDNEARDKHLKSPDFFDAEKFPQITFKSTKIVPAGKDKYTVTGPLTMHGVTKEVSLPVTFLGFVKDPWGGERAGFETSVTLDRKDYGILWNKTLDAGGALLGDDVAVSISLETTKKKDAPKK